MAAKLIMTQHDVDGHPEEWMKTRARSIGGSDIARLLGLAPKSHGSPFELFVEKLTGELINPGDDEDDERARGKALEGVVAEAFAVKRPDLEILPGGLFADADCPWMTATFDRFTVDRGADKTKRTMAHTSAAYTDPDIMQILVPAELKTAISRYDQAGRLLWGEEYTDQVPVWYKAQTLWQMQIWGADRVFVPVKFMGSWKTSLYIVNRTDEAQADIEFMVKMAAEFMDRLDRNDPPDLDWYPATMDALKFLNPLQEGTAYRATLTEAKQLRAAYLRMKAAEERYRLLQNRLAAKAGGAQKIVVPDPERTDGDGHPKDVAVMSRSRYEHPSYDLDRLRAEHPVVASQLERKTPVDKWSPGQRWMGLGKRS